MDLHEVRFDHFPHILCAQQFSRYWLEEVLFPEARKMKEVFLHGGDNLLRGKKMVNLFYQPSTRTRGSFQMAMSYRGGEVSFATENAREFSSAKKGESLEHTIKNWNRYFHSPTAGVIVLRHYEEGAAERAAAVSRVPIINAGDGPGQHPTQAFLDVFTIQEKLGGIDNISIALMGDLKNGRTARSLAYVLSKFNGVRIFLISSEESKMKDDVKLHLKEHGVWFVETNDIRFVADQLNAVYVIRDQKEYSNCCWGKKIYRRARGLICPNGKKDFLTIDRSVLDLLQKDAIVMHPLPIDANVKEIRPEVEDDPRVVCLTDQVDSGLFIRMALPEMILTPEA